MQIVQMKLRKGIPRSQLETETIEFVQANPGADAFDVCEALRIPFALAEEIMAALAARKLLRGAVE